MSSSAAPGTHDPDQLAAELWQHTRPALAVVLVGLIGAWLGVAVAGTTHTQLGPLAIDAEITPAWTGDTVLQVDPLGTLTFETHTAPLRVAVDVRSVELEALEQIVRNPAALNSLQAQLTDDFDSALRQAAQRTAIVAVFGAIVVGGLAFRSVRRALLSGVVAVGAVGLSYGLVLLTFDRDAMQEPQYAGLISTAPRLVGTVDAITADFGNYTQQLATLVTNITRVYDATLSLPTYSPTDDTIRVLHVADLHLNPAAWPIIRAVAEQYRVDVIVDAGDISDHGTATESRYVAPIGTLDWPYVYVKGNHDSVLTVAAIEENPNAIVLDNEPVTVAGLRFFGGPDPRFTPDQSTRGTADEALQPATEALADRARSLPIRPDVLVFHDPTDANLFEDTAPLVLAGHTHSRREIVLDDGTRIFIQGSTGGAGLRGLQHEDPTPVALSVLYFDPETKQLAARDDITLGGLGSTTAEVQRTQVEELSEEDPAEVGGQDGDDAGDGGVGDDVGTGDDAGDDGGGGVGDEAGTDE